jgi:hypothetical protein
VAQKVELILICQIEEHTVSAWTAPSPSGLELARSSLIVEHTARKHAEDVCNLRFEYYSPERGGQFSIRLPLT